MHQVGPQLGLHDHQQRRPHPVQEARHAARQVVGCVTVLDLVAQGESHPVAAGGRGGRDHEARPRQSLAQRAHQGHRRLHLAHGDRVQPDDGLGGRQRGAQPEALARPLEIGPVPRGAREQAQQHQRHEEVEQQAVDRPQGAQPTVGPDTAGPGAGTMAARTAAGRLGAPRRAAAAESDTGAERGGGKRRGTMLRTAMRKRPRHASTGPAGHPAGALQRRRHGA